MAKTTSTQIGMGFCGQWIIANVVGLEGATALLMLIASRGTNLVLWGWVLTGAVIGTSQWVVLRQETFWADCFRILLKFFPIAGYFSANISDAKMPAFTAPHLPTAITATGTPLGICNVARNESKPLKGGTDKGTAITGRVVYAAIAPARWNAPPTKAITASIPFALSPFAYLAVSSGVLCAESMFTS